MTSGSSSPDNRAAAHEAADEATLPALAWMRRAHAEEELLAEVSKQVRRRRQRTLTLAASTLVAIVVAGVFWIPGGRPARETDRSASPTATILLPEQRTLPDNSVVEIRKGAEIDIDFSGAFRRVILRQGEAHFQVAKNMAWPFVVEAAGVKVRAVGTAFSVELDAKQVEVLVTEGEVQVASLPGTTPGPGNSEAKPGDLTAAPRDEANAEPIMAAGYRAIIGLDKRATEIGTVSEAEMAEQLGWRTPSLEFSRTPLTEVVALMNEHATGARKVRFVIASPELHHLRLSGFLRTDNSEGLMRLLENNFRVKAERSGDTITLRKAE